MVTVLFCDVTGSTHLGERLDAEAYRMLLARYFERMRGIVERHGGSVEKFIGDAVMAVFGVPALHEDDAVRALRAAAEMREAFGELDVHGRIGVATGEVVTGTSERLVTGDAVNVAARLEQVARPGEVLVSAETAALAGAGATLEPVEPLALKGKAQPVVAYRLLSISAVADRGAATAMVGRMGQVALLNDTFAAVRRDGACHLFTILGTAGIGKSRLVAEFLGSAADANVVRSRCLSYGEGITYWPVVEMLQQLRERPADATAAAAVATLLGETNDPTTPDTIAWATRRTLEQAAHERPVICVFDDLHWGQPALLDLVEHIADFSRDAPMLILCVARPELLDHRPTWSGGKLNATTVLLEPLSADETGDLIARLVADGDMDWPLRRQIAEAAGGNPLFIEEMIAMASAAPEADLTVPPTIKAVLAARLDQLDLPERIVLERGSVEGKVFHRGAVQALLPEEHALSQRLQTLVRKELLRPEPPVLAGEEAFRFRHLLIRDAAYDAVPKGVRAELHAGFARWLEGHGAGLVELDEVIGYHLEQACVYAAELGQDPDPDRTAGARRHLLAAGRRAVMRGDAQAAAVLLGRASRLPSSPLDVLLEIDLSDALADAGDFDRGMRSAQAAGERAQADGNRLGGLALGLQTALLASYNDPEGAARRMLELVDDAMPEFEAGGYELGLFVGNYVRGEAEQEFARSDSAAVAFDQAHIHARRVGLPHLEERVLGWRMATRKDGSMPAAEFLAWLEALPDQARSGVLFVPFAAEARAMCGNTVEARAALRRVSHDVAERGDTVSLAIILGLCVAEIELFLGDPAAALDAGLRGFELLEPTGERAWLSTIAAHVAQALYQLDRVDEAEAWAERSAELGASDDATTQLLSRMVKAKALARRGEAARAEQVAQEALDIAGAIQQPNYQAIAYMDLATVLSLNGRRREARAARRRALELARQKANLPLAERIEAMLD